MEVVEHILHHVTDVGLHYTFPEQWGLRKGSVLCDVMDEAISKQLYSVEMYEDESRPKGKLLDDQDLLRVELQELAYWIITAYWDSKHTSSDG